MDLGSLGDAISTALHGLWDGVNALIPVIAGSALEIENTIGSGEPNEEVAGTIGDAIGSVGEGVGEGVGSVVTSVTGSGS